MHFEKFGWHSDRTGKYMEYLRFGNAGTPVIIFPSSGGNHYEFQERGMVEPLSWKIDEGMIQVFCVDTNNWDAWYNGNIHPKERIDRYLRYEEFLLKEFFPHIGTVCGANRSALCGISFGGYHAINFTLKHPEYICKAVSLSGSFDIKGLLDGYYDDLCYFNNPVDYIPNLADPWYLNMYNAHTELIFVSSERDNCLDRNIEMIRHLTAKGIRHQFIVWQGDYPHDWPAWREMIGHYI